MAWQLSCHGMCKIVTWLEHYSSHKTTRNFCAIHPSIPFLRLECCQCPIRWGWQMSPFCETSFTPPTWFSRVIVARSSWSRLFSRSATSRLRLVSVSSLLVLSSWRRRLRISRSLQLLWSLERLKYTEKGTVYSTAKMPTSVKLPYNTIIFFQHIHKRHPIPHLWGRSMGGISWFQNLICILNSPCHRQSSSSSSSSKFTVKSLNIRRTKSPNSNISHFGLPLSLRNILKPGVKSRMKM